MSQLPKPIDILLVEDNEGDIFLTKKAFQKAKIFNNVHVARDGEMAMDVLLKPEQHKIPMPDIIFLDINLPKKDGKQVLAEIKANERLRRIPVVILTSSRAEQDVIRSYNLHANSYIEKPVTLESFNSVVSAIENFWFSIVVLPQEIETHA